MNEFAGTISVGTRSAHFAQRRYQEAMSESLEARDVLAGLGKTGSAEHLWNIASIYSQLGKLDSGIEAMRLATGGDLQGPIISQSTISTFPRYLQAAKF